MDTTPEAAAADILDQVGAMWAKLANEWLRILEDFYATTENASFAWIALDVHLHHTRGNRPLPEWIGRYLAQGAKVVTGHMFSSGEPTRVPGEIIQGLGLTRPRSSEINKARELIEAATLFGTFEALRALARHGRKVSYAFQILRECWPFQSESAAQRAVRKARQNIDIMLEARGRDADDREASMAAAEVLDVAVKMNLLLLKAGATNSAVADARFTFGLTPARYARIKEKTNVFHWSGYR